MVSKSQIRVTYVADFMLNEFLIPFYTRFIYGTEVVIFSMPEVTALFPSPWSSGAKIRISIINLRIVCLNSNKNYIYHWNIYSYIEFHSNYLHNISTIIKTENPIMTQRSCINPGTFSFVFSLSKISNTQTYKMVPPANA